MLNIYQDAPKLVELSDALYQSVLVALARMLKYLKHNACRKVLKAFIKQQSFQSDLVRKIDDIVAARDEFSAEAELCHKEALQKLQDVTERDGDRVQDAISNLSQIVSISRREQERPAHNIREYFDLISQSYSFLTKDVREVKQLMYLLMIPLLETLKSNPRAIEAAYDRSTYWEPRKTYSSSMLAYGAFLQVKRLPDTDGSVDYHIERRPSLLQRIQNPKGTRH